MGISGLLPALKCIQTTRHLKEYAGQRVAVDAYVWLHKGIYACATDLATGKSTTKYVEYAMHRVRMLRYYQIEPYVVFDGGPLPAKRGTESERKKKRDENLKKGKALAAQNKHSQARECFIKCADVTPQMAYQLIKALKAEGVQYVVAPYEADAQLAYLERKGIVNAILTEDSDLLVFGCKTVLFKLDTTAHTVVSISRKDFGAVTTSCSDISLVGWSDTQFRSMAILSGCDYLPSIPGIGLKTACNLMRKWKTAEQVVKAVTLEGKKAVPAEYWQNFQLAEKCFEHQRVYCPVEERLVHMTPVGEDWTEEFDEFCGNDLEAGLAKQLAQGDVDPVELLPMVDINPNYKPQGLKQLPLDTTKIDRKGKGREVVAKPKATGGILNFFGPNPIIPPRGKAPPVPVQRPVISAGKASGKRTLVEIADQDIALRKKPRKSTPAVSQSRFFQEQEAAPRRHNLDLAAVAGPSRLLQEEKENLLPDDWEQEDDVDECDRSDLSVCAQKLGDSEVGLDSDLGTPPAVEQEDGYISPMGPSSPVNNAQDLSSPGYQRQSYVPDEDFGDPVSSPTSAVKRLQSYTFQRPQPLLGSQSHPGSQRESKSPRSQTTSQDDDDYVPTPATAKRAHYTRRSVSAGAAVLVDDSPTPVTRSYVLHRSNAMRPTSPPIVTTGALLVNPFGGEEFGDPSRDESSGSATPPTPSPDTPASAQRDMSRGAKVVIDVDADDLYDEDELVSRAAEAEERTKAVAMGWKQKWAMGSTTSLSSSASFSAGQKGRGSGDPTKSRANGKKKLSLSPSDYQRSNTNVTPAGMHSLAMRQPRVSFPGAGVKSKAKANGKVTPVTRFFQPKPKVALLKTREPIVIDDLSDEDDEIMIGSSPPTERALDRFRFGR